MFSVFSWCMLPLELECLRKIKERRLVFQSVNKRGICTRLAFFFIMTFWGGLSYTTTVCGYTTTVCEDLAAQMGTFPSLPQDIELLTCSNKILTKLPLRREIQAFFSSGVHKSGNNLSPSCHTQIILKNVFLQQAGFI